jgi:hypothetical protein
MAAAAAMAVLGPADAELAAAEEAVRWGLVSGWDVMVDPSLGNGCFIFTLYKNGTALRLGFNAADDYAYIMVGNEDWKSIETGKDYDIEIRMDRSSPWRAQATGVDFDGLPLLMATTTDSNFIVDFMKKRGVEFRYDGQVIANLSLSGTFAAVAEMLKCQEAVDRRGIGGRSSDPFAKAPAGGDPFAKAPRNASDPFTR